MSANPEERKEAQPARAWKADMALTVGGILAGWELDPGWAPAAGQTVTIRFGSGTSAVREGEGHGCGALPPERTVTIGVLHILAAAAMRAGGKGLSESVQAAVRIRPPRP